MFLATESSDPGSTWIARPFGARRDAPASMGRACRRMRVEQLESRIVLSTATPAESFAPFCTPVDPSTLPATTTPAGLWKMGELQYGPQQLRVASYADSSNHLQAPAMPGLTGLSSNIAGAVVQAWDIPADSMTDGWVVGLADGQSPQVLQQVGFEAAVQSPYLPNTFILQLGEARSVVELREQIAAVEAVEFYYPLIAAPLYSRLLPSDSGFHHQWYFRNTGQTMPSQTGGTPGEDIHIVDAWDRYLGHGVVIAIVDDGVQYSHYDLIDNAWTNPGEIPGNGLDDDGNGYIDDVYGYDFNDGDGDPSPVGAQLHGTQMAGIVAAASGFIPQRQSGIVGAAMGAQFASLRLTGAASTDQQQADALAYANQDIDIYNNSWGSADDGTLSAPGALTLAAIQNGVTNGRGGLGNIYVWAAGNGAAVGDNVNYDGYANSRYVIAVGALDHHGHHAQYSEPGAPILVAGYSANALRYPAADYSGVFTTTVEGYGDASFYLGGADDFTARATGTSVAAAQVSGVVALMLEANPNLTWRDVQHILANSARHVDPASPGWATNRAGHAIHYQYGFGAVDATAAVNLAETWTSVGPELTLSSGPVAVGQPIPDGSASGVSSTVYVDQAIKIEKIEVVLNATHPYRGDLRVVLTSPWGTESVLAETHDDGGADYNNWVFTTVRHWDEISYGDWTLTITDNYGGDAGTFDSWQINFYGTESTALDFGDAPTSFGTLLDDDGARHLIGGLHLGGWVDWEADGQPTADALGDGADEDGIRFIDPVVAGQTVRLLVTSRPAGGVLDFFFDFDGDGVFGNNANEVFSRSLAGGVELISIEVPEEAVAGTTYARFRLSSGGGLGPTGPAPDGEVEDYRLTLHAESPPRDFGDAPNHYGTLQADFGPSHFRAGPYLGSAVDVEPDGQGNAVATGDGRDEDGVHFGDLLIRGQDARIDVTSSPGGGVLDFFIDFNANGVFGDVASEVFRAVLTGGPQSIQITVPPDAVVGTTYGRFRISSAGDLGPLYYAEDGEVEDYQLVILAPPAAVLWESFDGVAAPALPSLWTTESDGSDWLTVASDSDTPPNRAFVANDGYISENRLISPPVQLPAGINQLRFRNWYNLEAHWDGALLEISINGGAPQDILEAGGSFVAGGYVDIVDTGYGNPIGGRWAWTGDSHGYIDTIVDLPPAALGQTVQFHWVAGNDEYNGLDGWSIDTIVLYESRGLDYGDAPDPPYPTWSAHNGAGHVVGAGVYLGALVDVDTDGQPTADATGDDANGDDEDGVIFTSLLIPGSTATVDVVASAAQLLSAWIDWNGDGDWLDAGEQVFQDYWVAAGVNHLSFDVPATSTTETFARFRLSTQSGLMPSGLAGDGEVEDYKLYIGLDFGDAPDTYGTLLASDGARHAVSRLRLGTAVDQEPDGQPTSDATGDGSDEDGILFLEPFVAGDTVRFSVTASGPGVLDYFFDFDGSGVFGDSPQEAFSATLAGGTQMLSVAVPEGAVAGTTYARFRLSSDGGLGPTGFAADGEVEDYAIELFGADMLRDFGDAPDVYATSRQDFGPSHFIGGPRLGRLVDAEPDGQSNAVATGDGRDDDGVHFGELLIAGHTAQIQVTSSPGGGVLDFFFDFNANGVFGDVPEEVFQALLTGGTQTLQVAVPANAVAGTTYARFRISTMGGLGPMFWAPDGEVEDYQVLILSDGGRVFTEWEYFDGVEAPALPDGWTMVAEQTPELVWTTVASDTESDTLPNHAFIPDIQPEDPEVHAYGLTRLTSPVIELVGGIDQLRFRHWFDLEKDEDGAWDGSVLEISINGGERQDILDAGGSFVTGGYTDTLDAYPDYGPLYGRRAWSGDSGGYVTTIVNLPPAAIGQSVQLHWILGVDSYSGAPGWRVDTIELGHRPYDFGDAADPPYPTLWANNGAGHVLGSGVYLGETVDADPDGQPSANGMGDDLDADGDDDDGVIFTSSLVPGSVATLNVIASAPQLLSAWFDFNADGVWNDDVEQVFQDLWLTTGTNSLSFMVPEDATEGATFARFRLSTQSGLMPDGLAGDGEVEDYLVWIGTGVVGRHIFYNNSKWDAHPGFTNGDPAANEFDDVAIAPDKQALLNGQKATFANYTSYSRGINGIMVDIAGLAQPAGLSAADFEFRTGNDNNPAAWPLLTLDPAQITIAVRAGAGVDGSDRVTILFPDGAVKKTWLQVTVKATDATGLAAPDVHYWGNAVGDSGNSRTDTAVDVRDALGVRANLRSLLNPAPIDLAFDYNRDKQVDVRDELVVRANLTTVLSDLNLIDLTAYPHPVGGEGEGEGESAGDDWGWADGAPTLRGSAPAAQLSTAMALAQARLSVGGASAAPWTVTFASAGRLWEGDSGAAALALRAALDGRAWSHVPAHQDLWATWPTGRQAAVQAADLVAAGHAADRLRGRGLGAFHQALEQWLEEWETITGRLE